MIRVNLLQIKRKKKPKPLPAFIILSVLVFVGTALVAALVFFNMDRKVKNLRALQKQNDVRIAELKKKVKEVDDFEAKNKQFEERKNVIMSLRQNQSVPVKVLNEISFLLADGVWLDDMDIKALNINVRGHAFTNSNVVEFVNNLKRSPLFSGVYLVESKNETIEDISVYQFALKFKIKV